MGDLLLHCTVVWINPPGSLLKGKKEPELAAFGMSQNILHKYRQILSKKKKKSTGKLIRKSIWAYFGSGVFNILYNLENPVRF